MNVLSLFDGISCGRLALERTDIKVDKYFSSEIDKYAIQIADKNYPQDKENRLGDVTKWREWDIDWSSIDLLIGGSPCQGFSFQGKQLNFEDFRSKLFFEYVDILNHIKTVNPDVKFLLENVVMKQEYQNIISNYLNIEPVLINSKIISGAKRPRLYWCNWNILELKANNVKLIDILENLTFNKEPYVEKYRSNKATNYKEDKFPTLRAQAGSRTRGIGICNDLGYWRKLTPVECERLQTLSDNYTQGVSNTQRYKMIGNGWTVDVIAHILKGGGLWMNTQ